MKSKKWAEKENTKQNNNKYFLSTKMPWNQQLLYIYFVYKGFDRSCVCVSHCVCVTLCVRLCICVRKKTFINIIIYHALYSAYMHVCLCAIVSLLYILKYDHSHNIFLLKTIHSDCCSFRSFICFCFLFCVRVYFITTVLFYCFLNYYDNSHHNKTSHTSKKKFYLWKKRQIENERRFNVNDSKIKQQQKK